MAERLRRLWQVFERHPLYFITACTFERRRLLANDALHAAFVTFAGQASERGAWVGRYVLMPDHVHFFVVIEDDRIGLSAWVKSLKNALSKTMRAQGFEAPHWQKGFFDHVLRGSESYSEKWGYVCANPVRAGLAGDGHEWPFAGEIHNLEYRHDLIL